jgi:hypothetical protein
LGFSALIIQNLFNECFGKRAAQAQWGEIFLGATSGINLPLGIFGRLPSYGV